MLHAQQCPAVIPGLFIIMRGTTLIYAGPIGQGGTEKAKEGDLVLLHPVDFDSFARFVANKNRKKN